MSGVIDCMTRVAGASIDLAKELGQESFRMVGELTGGFIEGIGDIKEAFRILLVEEKQVYQEALKKYEDSLLKDEKEKDKYVSKLANDKRVLKLQIEDIPFSSNKLEMMNAIFKCAVLIDKCETVFNELNKGIEEYEELEKIKDMLKSEIEKQNYRGIASVSELLNKKYVSLREEIREIIDNKKTYDINKMESIYVSLQEDIGEAYFSIFNNELEELLETEDNSLEKKNLLLELRKKMLEYASKLNNLEYIDGVEECQNMIKFVYDTLNDNDISDDLKIERISIRVDALRDDYLKCESKNAEIFKLKERLDKTNWLNMSYKKYLNQEVITRKFNFNELEKEIMTLEKENKELYVLCEKKQKTEYIRMALKEAMIKNDLEYISSKAIENGTKKIEQDVYHIEDGNVVTVTFDNDEMKCVVGSVSIDGIYNDENKALESMKKFCSKYDKIEEELENKGVIIEKTRRLAANVKYIHDVKLEDESKEIIKNKIKKSVNKRSELKRKRLGEE